VKLNIAMFKLNSAMVQLSIAMYKLNSAMVKLNIAGCKLRPHGQRPAPARNTPVAGPKKMTLPASAEGPSFFACW